MNRAPTTHLHPIHMKTRIGRGAIHCALLIFRVTSERDESRPDDANGQPPLAETANEYGPAPDSKGECSTGFKLPETLSIIKPEILFCALFAT